MTSRSKLLALAVAVSLMALPALVAEGQAPTDDLQYAINGLESVTPNGFQGMPTDWTHQHVVFSEPPVGSERYYALQKDPRYWLEKVRRSLPQADVSAQVGAQALVARQDPPRGNNRKVGGIREVALQFVARHDPPRGSKGGGKKPTLKRDWRVNMGASATVGLEMFPAKFTFNPPLGPDCTNDYVVFNTGLPGASGQASIFALNDLYATTCSNVPSTLWAYNTGGTVSLSPVLSIDGTQVAFVQTDAMGHANLVVLKWGAGGTITSPTTPTSSGSYPSCTAPCMIALPFNGSPSSPNDTNSPPFIDYFGDTAYAGDDAGVLHKFTPIFGGGTPAEVTTGGWPLTVDSGVMLSGAIFDSGGSRNIFVGDAGGTAWYVREVGSSSGSCSSGSPPCLGTPSVTVASGAGGTTTNTVVDPPLVDIGTQEVFWSGTSLGSSNPTLVDKLTQTTTALGSPVTITESNGKNSPTRAGKMHTGAFDNTYLTSASNNKMGFLYFCALNPGNDNHPSLWRVGFSSSGVMNGSTNMGALEFANSSSSENNECSPLTEILNSRTVAGCSTNSTTTLTCPSGTFAAADVGASVTGTNIPANDHIASFTSSTTVTLSAAATGTGATTVTISDDFLFGSVQDHGHLANNCNGGGAGCLYSFNITTSFPTAATAPLAENGGTSGIIIDNVSSTAGASQVYFSSIGSSTSCVPGSQGCAVQAAQSGL